MSPTNNQPTENAAGQIAQMPVVINLPPQPLGVIAATLTDFNGKDVLRFFENLNSAHY